MNQLFSVVYRPGPMDAPVTLVCQALEAGGELLLWVDGLNLEHPVLVPISAVKQIRPLGTFGEFAKARLEAAHAVLHESQGEHSPTLIARAMLYMEADAKLSANEALELAHDQALDLLDADNMAALMFQQAQGQQAATTVAAAA